MFFLTQNNCFHLLSVLSLQWNGVNANSAVRPYAALSLRLSGDAIFSYGKEQVRAETGELVFVPAYCNYHLSAGRERLIVLHFTADFPLPDKIIKYKTQKLAYFSQKFEEIYRLWLKKQPGDEYQCMSVFYKIVAEIEAEYAKDTTENNNPIVAALECINDRFLDPTLSVAELARLCLMSDTSFRKLFQKQYGCTPCKYLNRRKTEYALELLRSKYYTVQEVSARCGFENVYYFSSFIKKETGLSPKQYIKGDA